MKLPAWGDDKAHNPLEAWRLLVLGRNKEYRRDAFIQEATAEIGLRYLRLWNRNEGRDLKARLVKAARWLPLVPALNPDFKEFNPPVVGGPFDFKVDGEPLIPERVLNSVLERAGLRRGGPAPPPGRMPVRRMPGRPTPAPPVPTPR